MLGVPRDPKLREALRWLALVPSGSYCKETSGTVAYPSKTIKAMYVTLPGPGFFLVSVVSLLLCRVLRSHF